MNRNRRPSLLLLMVALACQADAPRTVSSSRPDAAKPAAPKSPTQQASAPQPAAARWPQTFLRPGVLVAREVRLVGPMGLYDHVAVRQEPNFHEHVVRTTPDGLETVVTLKSGVEAIEIRAYLDQLAIAAEQRLLILERPTATSVTVEALGDAMLKLEGQSEQRSSMLRLVGEPPR